MKAVVLHGIGVDRLIDAVGIDARHPQRGPAAEFYPIGQASCPRTEEVRMTIGADRYQRGLTADRGRQL